MHRDGRDWKCGNIKRMKFNVTKCETKLIALLNTFHNNAQTHRHVFLTEFSREMNKFIIFQQNYAMLMSCALTEKMDA